MIQSGHQAAVSIHVPRSDHQEYFAVAQIKAVVAAETFHRLEFEGLLVEFGNGGWPGAPQGDVIDPSWLLPPFLQIALTNICHAFLREIELIAVGIVTSQAGEGDVALALGNVNVRIKLFQPVAHFLDVIHFEAEVIEAGSESGLAL